MRPNTIQKDQEYALMGDDFERLWHIATRLNTLSGQRLKGHGDEVRDLAQTIHAIIEKAEGPL